MRILRLRLLRSLCSLAMTVIFSNIVYAEDVQKSVVAGYFYPKDKSELKTIVDGFIERAEPADIEGDIVAVIAPHAGYQYSGWVAGYAFKAIKTKPIKTAIIIAPSHRYGFDGLSVLDRDSYLTPLGKVAIDKEITKELLAFDKRIQYHMPSFLEEHAAEVEIPFLQEALSDFKIVVILIGGLSYDNCTLLRDALTKILKGKSGVILVASSDMSHYRPESEAKRIDQATLSTIEKFDPEALFLKFSGMPADEVPCGGAGIVGIMMTARNLGADSVKVLRYATSGDVTGDKGAVVGYASVVIYKSKVDSRKSIVEMEEKKEKEMEALLNEKQKKRLLEIARTTIESYIKDAKTAEFKEDDPVLNKKMGAFVTIHKHGELRGCIGNMVGEGPLYLTIRDMAIAASTEDPRFTPVRKDELKDIDIEISVLSPMKKIDSPDEIVMGKHGVMVRSGFRSGIYLPQVATETGWSKEEFMSSLCLHKAGLAADSWKKGSCDIYIFTAEVFGEQESAKGR